MSYKGIVVVFAQDVVEDELKALIGVLRQLKNVAELRLLDAEPEADLAVFLRADAVWRERLQKMLRDADTEARWRELNKRSSEVLTRDKE
jgi:hypothetical protein